MKFQAGQSLIELMVAIGLAAVILPALLTGFVATRSGRAQGEQRQQAIALVREAQEAVRVFREADWNTFAALSIPPGTIYHPVSGTSWELSNGSESLPGGFFTRSITIADVYRDSGTFAIVDSSIPGSINDPSTKQVTVTVAWNTPIPNSAVSSTEYLTRFGNTAFSESGTVQPPASGFGNWCSPSQSPTTVDLSRQGVPTTIWAFEADDGTGNRVFSGTGGNSSGPAFTNTKVIGNGPPTASLVGDYNDTPKVKINGEFGNVDADYAYITTDSNSAEVKILDLNQFTDPPTNSQYTNVGWFDSPGPTDGNSVSVSGSFGYMTAGNKFYVFNLSSKNGSRSQIGNAITLDGVGVKIYIVGDRAYIAISESSTKMQIINISNPESPSIEGSYVNSNLGSGRDIFVKADGTRAYLATAESSTQPEFFIINTEIKSSPTLVAGGTYETNGMDPQGVTIVTGQKAIIVGKNGSLQYQVIDISIETSPSSCGPGLQISGGANAVSSILQSDGHAYSYVVTGDAHAELKIIEGGSGGGGSGNGVFESSTLPVPDPGHDVAFNYFSATVDPSLSYAIAIKHGTGGSCSSVTFSALDFFSISTGPITLPGVVYSNPGQCLRYKVINSGSTAIPYTVTVNYSP